MSIPAQDNPVGVSGGDKALAYGILIAWMAPLPLALILGIAAIATGDMSLALTIWGGGIGATFGTLWLATR